MTRVNGFGDRYELVERPKSPLKPGMVAVIYNNGPEIHIPKEDFEGYTQVADSKVEQGGFEL